MSQRAVTDHPEPPTISNVFIVVIQGFPSLVIERAAERHRALTAAALTECPAAIGPPAFTKKCPWIPTRTSYKGTFPEEWWRQWIPNLKSTPGWMSPVKLYDLSRSLGYPGLDRVRRVCTGLEEGFSIGATGSARLPAHGDNWSSVYTHGEKFCDAVQQWLLDGLVMGPFSREELPDNIRVSPSAVEIKPLSNRARVCVDMSWPHIPKHEVDLGGSIPTSVNSGIDVSLFPVNMVSTKDILIRCFSAGRGTFLAKQDWADAYKVICCFS